MAVPPSPADRPPRIETLSVLFADLRGFAPYCERETAPERLLATLNGWIELASRAVADAGGVREQVLGDGILASFGAGGAQAALTAAAAMLHVFPAWLAAWSAGDPAAAGLDLGLGIATGPAIRGAVGGHCTVVGTTVNRAARLMQAARGGCRLVIDEATLAAGSRVLEETQPLLPSSGIAADNEDGVASRIYWVRRFSFPDAA
jgi:adenylate cyclase